MATRDIDRIVIGSLIGGLVVAPALVVGPVAGAQEHVITGTMLLAFPAGWAVLAMLSMRWTSQPQRWAMPLAGFMDRPAQPFSSSHPAGRSSMRSGGSGRRSSSRCSLEP